MKRSGDKMVIDLTGLNNGRKSSIEFELEHVFNESDFESTDITTIMDFSVTGVIRVNSINNLLLDAYVSGTMIIPCAITLKPVNHYFDVNINEILEDDNYYQNSIDILPIIWENILLEIPMRVVSKETETVTSGEGWNFEA